MRVCYFVLPFTLAAILAAGPTPARGQHKHDTGQPPQQLGRVHFETSCAPAVRAEFDRAVALLHSFWFGASADTFRSVAAKDPGCAMAWWGVAMAMWGNPFAPARSENALRDGGAAIEKAQSAVGGTERERAYIAAARKLFASADTVGHRTRIGDYEQAMKQVYEKYPQDREAAAFYALAVNQTALPTDKTYSQQLKAAAVLEELFKEQPDHPGAAHYLIHAYDHPALAERALPAARRYAKVAPDAPHALHMPSHIFTRIGDWQASIDTNIASANAAKARLPESGGQIVSSGSALHAMDYMAYGYLQLGQDAAAKALVEEIDAIKAVPVEELSAAYALAAIPARYVLERGQWAEAAALTVNAQALTWERFPQAEATLVFARGLSAARAGDADAARQEVERLHDLHAALVTAKQDYWAGQVEIQSREVDAWIAHAEGRNDEALALMGEAVALEAATEKHPVTPGPIAPAHELLGEMLLALDQPAAALAEFEASLVTEPNRFRGLYGAARAAELAGEAAKAHTYYEQLIALGANADSKRAEVVEAEAFLAK